MSQLCVVDFLWRIKLVGHALLMRLERIGSIKKDLYLNKREDDRKPAFPKKL